MTKLLPIALVLVPLLTASTANAQNARGAPASVGRGATTSAARDRPARRPRNQAPAPLRTSARSSNQPGRVEREPATWRRLIDAEIARRGPSNLDLTIRSTFTRDRLAALRQLADDLGARFPEALIEIHTGWGIPSEEDPMQLRIRSQWMTPAQSDLRATLDARRQPDGAIPIGTIELATAVDESELIQLVDHTNDRGPQPLSRNGLRARVVNDRSTGRQSIAVDSLRTAIQSRSDRQWDVATLLRTQSALGRIPGVTEVAGSFATGYRADGGVSRVLIVYVQDGVQVDRTAVLRRAEELAPGAVVELRPYVDPS